MTKKKNPKDLLKVGRKCILETNPAVVGKLESAFAIGADVTLACRHAGISRDAYYEYLKKHPEKADEFKKIQETPILKALNTVVKNLNDPKTAKWYLIKKRPEEFGYTQNINLSGGLENKVTTDEELKALIEGIISINKLKEKELTSKDIMDMIKNERNEN